MLSACVAYHLDVSKSAQQSRWNVLVPIAILAASIAFFCLVEAQFSVTGKPSVDILLMMAVVNLALYCWLRAKSDWKTKSQIIAVAVFCGLQLLALITIKMEGLSGNGRPVFSWRWAALPADGYQVPEQSESGAIDIETIEVSLQADWPQFRGPFREGIVTNQIADWELSPPELMWKQPIGAGWSSFAVAGEYCFTLEQRGDDECLVGYRIVDGKQIWVNSRSERFSEISGGEGPRATPTYDAGFLYSLGATGVLQRVDATNGKTVWETNILRDIEGANCIFGMCGSPLVTDGKVIVSPGGKGNSLVAYDKLRGDKVWQAGDSDASYSSPVRVKLCGVDQILIFNGDGLYSHDMKSGSVLWHVDWVSNVEEKNNVCQPIQLSDDEVFLSSGYGMGCARIRLEEKVGGDWKHSFVWKTKNLKSKFSSAVFDGENIFGLDLGILVCLDAKTGKRLWKNGRYAHGQFIMAGDFLIVQAERGFVAQVLAAADNFKEAARVPALTHRTWTHPAMAKDVLLIRNDREMAAFRLK